MKSFTRSAVVSVIGLAVSAFLFVSPAFAEPPPIQELDGSAPAPALSAGGEQLLADAASKVDAAAAYPVDYVNFARNLFLIAAVYLTMRYIGSANSPRKKRKGDEPKKGGGWLLFLAMVGLLATQALSFYLYTGESGPPGRMHKTVPLGREYFVY